MANMRNMFPGGNSCCGFFSFYQYMIPETACRKVILKGGPGVGKSTLMKNLGNAFSKQGHDVEFHWCSSDNQSLDGIVVGDQNVCVLDGTAPHTVDPRFPGAFDEIINLGECWDETQLVNNRDKIITLTKSISKCFERAYNRLKEAQFGYLECKAYTAEATQTGKANRNILALADEFLQHASKLDRPPRHLFAAAITPQGVVNTVDSLIGKTDLLFAVKGNPGSGVKELFNYIVQLASLNEIYLEIYHSPFNPEEIDLILLPHNHTALIDISGWIVNYQKNLNNRKYKRLLDFNQFIDDSILDANARNFALAKERFENGIQEAVHFIEQAKNLHDNLESYYVPAMNFDKITTIQEELFEKLSKDLQ
ncbi:MAG: PRK06851 family protein [Bacillota bacterium]|nr:PRK06851 family protein [Bacillota bacterium]